MHSDFLYLFLYIFIFYRIGFISLLSFFLSVLRKRSFFVICGIAWALGNCFGVLVLYVLAFAQKLSIITPLNIFVLCVVFLILLLLILYKKKVHTQIVQSKNLKATLVIGVFFLIFFFPLLKNALFSYLIDWDSIAIWLLKARVFFYAGGVWSPPFFNDQSIFQYAHKAYPVGFSLLISGYYMLIGKINDQAVQLYISMFYLNLVFIVYGFFRERMYK